MARSYRGLEDFLDFASSPAWRSAIWSAAVSFALCHLLVLLTPPFDLNAGADVVNAPQLMHLIGVVLRFAAPVGCFAAGLHTFAGQRRAAARA